MRKYISISIVLLIASSLAKASSFVEYQGVAKDSDRIVYIEKHKVEYDDKGKLVSARTRYESSDGKLIAELNSDFKNSLTVPDHSVRDYRTGNVQGLRRSGKEVVLFDQDKGKEEKTRVLTEKDADDRILVGCQGLNYYLLGNLESLDTEKKLPLRFLIPGKLDYYDFDMKEIGDPKANVAEFEVKVNSWLLNIFAPSLYVRYDRKLKRIVRYEGISNIKSDSGGNQKVVIEYEYEKGKIQ